MKASAMEKTPLANRPHILFLGRMNAGKSSIINALAHQRVSIVSDIPGTTTDPVVKSMEIAGLGAVALVDTAGIDDKSELGAARIAASEKALASADIAVLVIDGDEAAGRGENDFSEELAWSEKLKSAKIPFIIAINKSENISGVELAEKVENVFGQPPISISAHAAPGVDPLIAELQEVAGAAEERTICGDLVSAGDTVLLVMPQDIQAPKGRLILPQVQTIRDLLEHKCTVVSVTADGLSGALGALANPPELIIADSQVISAVYDKKPAESRLTSFSMLFAAYKGDIDIFIAGARAIDSLKDGDSILIAEACTHNPLDGDIAREKLPALLRAKTGKSLNIKVVSGNDFPGDIKKYALIIHCGACMFNRKHVMSRIDAAERHGVPITNYGVAFAYMNGILQ